jgi:hypothetical protein
MHKVTFNHVDKNLIFSVSSVPWDETKSIGGNNPVSLGNIPPTSSRDKGKILQVNNQGAPAWVVYSNDGHIVSKNFDITGSFGSPAANMNAMSTPLVIQPGEFWTISDKESGKAYIWTGGPGIFGIAGKGSPVSASMLSGVGTVSGAKFEYATEKEAADGNLKDKAMSPETSRFLDIDGGEY